METEVKNQNLNNAMGNVRSYRSSIAYVPSNILCVMHRKMKRRGLWVRQSQQWNVKTKLITTFKVSRITDVLEGV